MSEVVVMERRNRWVRIDISPLDLPRLHPSSCLFGRKCGASFGEDAEESRRNNRRAVGEDDEATLAEPSCIALLSTSYGP